MNPRDITRHDGLSTTRLLAALLFLLVAGNAGAATARAEYQAALRAIEAGDRTARRDCASLAAPARKACLEKAARIRAASRAEAGTRLKSADVGRASGREIMEAYQESVAEAARTGHAAATVKCDAMGAEQRAACSGSVKAAYRR